MPKNTKSINSELFNLLKSRGYSPTPYDSNGKVAPVIDDAEVFQFNFKKDGVDYGPVTLSVDGTNDLKIYYGDEVAGSPKSPQINEEGDHTDLSWYQLIRRLKKFAKNRQLGFELSDQDDLKYDMAKRVHTKNISEGYHAMGKQKSWNDAVPTVKMILKHSRPIGEGEQRFRNVEKIFIENSIGERILAPTNKPGVARAFARHIAEGGSPNDERWNHIKSICEDYSKLGGFIRATRRGQFNESAQKLVDESVQHYHDLRSTLHKLSSKRGYGTYFESWTPTLVEDDESASEDLDVMFRNSRIDPRIESALPVLKKISKKLTETSLVEVDELEEWANEIIGENSIPTSPEEIETVTDLLLSDEPLLAGPNGQNAIKTLDGYLEDDDLSDELKKIGSKDPDLDTKDTIADWMHDRPEPKLKNIAYKYQKEKAGKPEKNKPFTKKKEAPPAPPPAAPQPAAPAAPQPAAPAAPQPPVKENISMKQKKVGQLGPTEKISKSNPTRGKLVGVAENKKSDKLKGTPVVSLSDFDGKDNRKNKYGQSVPKKLTKDDPRVKFHKELSEDEYDEFENQKLTIEDAAIKMFTRLANNGVDPRDIIMRKFGVGQDELDFFAQIEGFKNSAAWLNSFKKSKKGVAEGEGKTRKYEMMMRNGQVKKFVAKDDADAKRIAAGHGAKSVIRLRGGVPAGKVAEKGVAEGNLEEVNRRGFLKGMAGAAAAGAAGYGVHKLDKWSTEEHEKLASYIKDPADLQKYEELRKEYLTYYSISGGKTDSPYHIMAMAKAAELAAFRRHLAKKYGFQLDWIGTVKESDSIPIKNGEDQEAQEVLEAMLRIVRR